jgi:hypothetical protein
MSIRLRKSCKVSPIVLNIWLLLLLLFEGTAIHAQGSATSAHFRSRLHAKISSDVSTVMSRYLPANQYHFLVQVDIAPLVSQNIPYLPNNYLDADDYKFSEAIQRSIKKLTVTVFLPPAISQQGRAQFAQILNEELSLRPARGDSLVFKDFVVAAATGEASPEIMKLKDEIFAKDRVLRDTESRLRELETALTIAKEKFESAPPSEKPNLEAALESFKKQIMDEIQRQSAQAQQLVSANDKLAKKEDDLSKTFITEQLTYLVIALLIMGAILFGVRSLSNGFAGIGQGLASMGAALQSALGQRREGSDGSAKEANANLVPEHQYDLGDIQNHLGMLREEIKLSIRESNELAILRHINETLSNGQTLHAVATLEIVGHEYGNRLFAKLPKDYQNRINAGLRSKEYLKDKYVLMMEAGEQLKTKLLESEFNSYRQANNQRINEFIGSRSFDEIMAFIGLLDKKLLGRFYVYLSPEQIGKILEFAHGREGISYNRLFEGLMELPNVEKEAQFDQALEAQINKFMASINRGLHEPYMKLYESILGDLSEEALDEVLEAGAAIDQRVTVSLQSELVSIRTFFRITQQQQQRIIEDLSNREIAALTFILEEKDRQIILGCVGRRRVDMVLEELEILKDIDSLEFKATVASARTAVVATMKELKAKGQLEFNNSKTRMAG